MTLPDSNFLSAPLWLFTVLHILTFSLHLLAMNFVVGGILIVLFGGFADRWKDPTVRKFIRLFPTAMSLTVTLGIAPLLFLQVVFPQQVYSAAIVSGWYWLLVAPAVIAGYYSLYRASFAIRDEDAKPFLPLVLALCATIFVSLVYSSVFSMAESPDLIRRLYAQNQSGTIFNPEIGDYIMRWAHMILGAMTVGGFLIGLIGRDNPGAFIVGKKFFMAGFVLASLAGMIYLMTLGPYLATFMHTPGVWSLLIGILLGLGSMHLYFSRKFGLGAMLLFLSLVSMVINRHYVRLLKLHDKFDPSAWRVETQWSPLVLFLFCFVGAVGVVWYMVALFFGEKAAD
jgi:hypothetical protein